MNFRMSTNKIGLFDQDIQSLRANCRFLYYNDFSIFTLIFNTFLYINNYQFISKQYTKKNYLTVPYLQEHQKLLLMNVSYSLNTDLWTKCIIIVMLILLVIFGKRTHLLLIIISFLITILMLLQKYSFHRTVSL